MVDVSAECTVNPISPNTLTATGGAVVSGTMNVMIRCTCRDGNNQLNIRWYNSDGDRLVSETNPDYVAGTPYIAFINNNQMNTELVIPTFTDAYDGTYTCGRIAANLMNLPDPTAEVVLTICKLIFSTISYFVYT